MQASFCVVYSLTALHITASRIITKNTSLKQFQHIWALSLSWRTCCSTVEIYRTSLARCTFDLVNGQYRCHTINNWILSETKLHHIKIHNDSLFWTVVAQTLQKDLMFLQHEHLHFLEQLIQLCRVYHEARLINNGVEPQTSWSV